MSQMSLIFNPQKKKLSFRFRPFKNVLKDNVLYKWSLVQKVLYS